MRTCRMEKSHGYLSISCGCPNRKEPYGSCAWHRISSSYRGCNPYPLIPLSWSWWRSWCGNQIHSSLGRVLARMRRWDPQAQQLSGEDIWRRTCDHPGWCRRMDQFGIPIDLAWPQHWFQKWWDRHKGSICSERQRLLFRSKRYLQRNSSMVLGWMGNH